MTATANISNVKAPAGAKQIVFRSRHSGMILWRKQPVEVRNVHGQLQYREEGKSYAFTNGVLVTFEGQDVFPDGYDADAGEVVDQDVVSWLRNHPDLNSPAPGGFFEEGREPDRLLPTEQDVLGEITRASIALDVDELVAIAEREQASHRRPLLLTAAAQALEAIAAIPDELRPDRVDENGEPLPDDEAPRNAAGVSAEADRISPEGGDDGTAENAVDEPVRKPRAKKAAE